jgi:hypothetical protein
MSRLMIVLKYTLFSFRGRVLYSYMCTYRVHIRGHFAVLLTRWQLTVGRSDYFAHAFLD